MPLNTKELPSTTKTKAPVLEVGSYPARVVQVIDLGLQKREWKGEVKDPQYYIRVTYELLDEFMPDEDGNPDESRPRWLGEDFPIYPLSVEKAKSTARYYAIDPNEEAEGDWSKLLGMPVMVGVVQNPDRNKPNIIYNNVGGLSAMRAKEREKAPELVNPPKLFSLDDPDLEIFMSIPEWIQDKIKESLEFEGSKLQAMLSDGKKEDKPVKKEASEEDEDW